MPATISPPGLSHGSRPGRLGLPERVAQLLGERSTSASWPLGSSRASVARVEARVGLLGRLHRRGSLPHALSGRLRRASADGARPARASRSAADRARPRRARRPSATCAPAPTTAAGAEDRVAHARALADARAVEQRRSARRRAPALDHARRGPSTVAGPTIAPSPTCTPSPSSAGPRTSPAMSQRSPTATRARVERAAPACGAHAPGEDVRGALQVALGRPDVEPVGLAVGEAAQPALGEHRPDLALDRDVAVRRDQVEHRALEHVGAGADQVGVDLLGARLLEEAEHAAVVVDAHEAVGARILDRHERERPGRAAALVAARSGRAGRCR